MVEAPDLAASAEIGVSPAAPAIQSDCSVAGGVMVGIPCYGGMIDEATMRGMLELQGALSDRRIPFGYVTTRNESLVQRARNTIVAHFLASGFGWLLFVDGDIGFTADQVLRLLAHQRPLIGGLYRRKDLNRCRFVVNMDAGEGGTAKRDPRTGAIRVAAIGTGFMLIRRDVLTRMVAHYPRTRYGVAPGDGEPGEWRSHTYALFDTAIDQDSGHYLSEDYLFCRRWRDMGGEVWADPGLVLAHHGSVPLIADPMQDIRAATRSPAKAAPASKRRR